MNDVLREHLQERYKTAKNQNLSAETFVLKPQFNTSEFKTGNCILINKQYHEISYNINEEMFTNQDCIITNQSQPCLCSTAIMACSSNRVGIWKLDLTTSKGTALLTLGNKYKPTALYKVGKTSYCKRRHVYTLTQLHHQAHTMRSLLTRRQKHSNLLWSLDEKPLLFVCRRIQFQEIQQLYKMHLNKAAS